MKTKFTFWVTILLLTPKSYSQCTIIPSNIYSFVYDGRTYEVVKEQKSWLDAVSCAVNRGGYLVEINSLDEQNAISTQIPSAGINFSQTVVPESGSPGLWLGGNDINVEGNWVWNGNNDGTSQLFYSTTGGSILFSRFGCSASNPSICEPDNFMGNQDALVIQTHNWPIGAANQWNDVNASNLLYFIIEYDFFKQ